MAGWKTSSPHLLLRCVRHWVCHDATRSKSAGGQDQTVRRRVEGSMGEFSTVELSTTNGGGCR